MFAATDEKESPAYATLLQSLPAFITAESDSDCEKLVNSYEQGDVNYEAARLEASQLWLW